MARVKSAVVSVLAVALVATGTVLVNPTVPAVAAEKAPRTKPTVPIKGERFQVVGMLSSNVERPVRLRMHDGTRWRVIRRAETGSRGFYSFTGVRTRAARGYQVVAPRVKRDGRVYKRVVTARTTVKPVRQRSRLAMLPQISQHGDRVAGARKAKSAIDVQFRPARKGRLVRLQRRNADGSWTAIARQRQSNRGRVTFLARATRPNGAPHVYRAVAVRYRGAAAKRTGAKRTDVWGKPSFADEFRGTSLNFGRWDYRMLGKYNPDGSRKCSKSARGAVRVQDGTVRLMVKRDRSRRGEVCRYTDARGTTHRLAYYLNGHIGTHGNFDFTHGVAAARVKFPRSQGQHGAFWMQPSNPPSPRIAGDPANSGAEVDVVEYFGAGRKDGGLASFLYFLNRQGVDEKVGGVWPRASRLKPVGDDWFKSYHVFSVEWTPRMYIFRVDGREFFRTRKGVSRIDQYLILSLLTSDWELPRLDKSTLPSTMHVDWVRAWEK